MSKYQATHTDTITRELRAGGWFPRAVYVCGCAAGQLCAQHATIRAVEHYHPELAR
jgi:hypothetical protein